jgi:hypothetical protein
LDLLIKFAVVLEIMSQKSVIRNHVSAQLTSFPPFSLSVAASLPIDIVTPLRRVTLPS